MKRTCQSCGARFYDLNHSTIACPKCGTVYDPEAGSRTRRGRSAAAEGRSPAACAGAGCGGARRGRRSRGRREIEAEVEEADEEEELIEDTSELGEDEDDMAEVIENVEGEEER